jgi:hypothetical protein
LFDIFHKICPNSFNLKLKIFFILKPEIIDYIKTFTSSKYVRAQSGERTANLTFWMDGVGSNKFKLLLVKPNDMKPFGFI